MKAFFAACFFLFSHCHFKSDNSLVLHNICRTWMPFVFILLQSCLFCRLKSTNHFSTVLWLDLFSCTSRYTCALNQIKSNRRKIEKISIYRKQLFASDKKLKPIKITNENLHSRQLLREKHSKYKYDYVRCFQYLMLCASIYFKFLVLITSVLLISPSVCL